MEPSEIIDVQVQWLNTDYYATMILKTTQDGKICEVTEQVTSEHPAVSGNSTPRPAYGAKWSVHN
jgi:hypothetical protein